MEPLPTPARLKLYSLLDRVQMSGLSGWVIVALLAVLMILFLALLLSRRTQKGIFAYFILAWLPLVTGIWGATSVLCLTIRMQPREGFTLDMLTESLQPLILGAAVTFAALLAAAMLSLLGPVPRPPVSAGSPYGAP